MLFNSYLQYLHISYIKTDSFVNQYMRRCRLPSRGFGSIDIVVVRCVIYGSFFFLQILGLDFHHLSSLFYYYADKIPSTRVEVNIIKAYSSKKNTYDLLDVRQVGIRRGIHINIRRQQGMKYAVFVSMKVRKKYFRPLPYTFRLLSGGEIQHRYTLLSITAKIHIHCCRKHQKFSNFVVPPSLANTLLYQILCCLRYRSQNLTQYVEHYTNQTYVRVHVEVYPKNIFPSMCILCELRMTSYKQFILCEPCEARMRETMRRHL